MFFRTNCKTPDPKKNDDFGDNFRSPLGCARCTDENIPEWVGEEVQRKLPPKGRFYKGQDVCNWLFRLIFLCLQLVCCAFAENISDFTANLVQPPVFESTSKTDLSGDEIVKIIRPILRTHLADTNYDRMGGAMQLVEYYQHRECTLSEIAQFQYITELRGDRGASCVNLSLKLHEKIPKEMNAYVTAAILPKKYHQFAAPKFCHAAVVIAFENQENPLDHGYVLLDSGFDFAEPIILSRSVPQYIYDVGKKGVWVFTLNLNTIECQIYPHGLSVPLTDEEKERLTMVYRLDRFVNPIESSALPMVFIDRRLSLLARDSYGAHTAHLNIELDNKRILWDAFEERQEPVLFDQFLQDKFAFDDAFASCLGMSSENLNNEILYILKNQHILKEIYIQYLELIRRTQDFSIVGEIDLTKLDSIIDAHRRNQS